LTAAPEHRGHALDRAACRRAATCRAAGLRPRGFGLVEVLATLAIAGVGLLGQALLLQHCLAAESAALRRTQASALLAALAERIRANATARADYALPAGTPAPAVPACAATATCTPAQTAALDLAQWRARVAATLPAPPVGEAPSVEVVAAAGGMARTRITLQWAEPGTGAAASMSLSVMLPEPAP
jgi:type IV pilus modification protein PilV